MIKPGLVVPQYVGYSALAAAAVGVALGAMAYSDVTNRISNLETRMTAIEQSAVPTQRALGEINATLARLEERIDFVLRGYPPNGGASMPYVPGGAGRE